MVEFIDTNTGKTLSYHIDGKLQNTWDKIRCGKLINLDEDRVYCVTGREGVGKSWFAIQQAKYLDPTFSLERIVFTPEEFVNQIRTCPKGSAIIFDEAFRGMNSKSALGKMNKLIEETLMECRQRNLIIFIVLPSFFRLAQYTAIERTEILFLVYKTKEQYADGRYKRGFKAYPYQKKRELYWRGKRNFCSYAKPKTKLRGRFFMKNGEEYGIDKEAYEKKKLQAFQQLTSQEEEIKVNKQQVDRDKILTQLYKEQFHSTRKLSKWLRVFGVELSHQLLDRIIHKYTENKEKTPTANSQYIIVNNDLMNEAHTDEKEVEIN